MSELLIDELKKLFPKQSGKFKVMIAGTFDIIHTGHLYLISEAAKIGDLIKIQIKNAYPHSLWGYPAGALN